MNFLFNRLLPALSLATLNAAGLAQSLSAGMSIPKGLGRVTLTETPMPDGASYTFSSGVSSDGFLAFNAFNSQGIASAFLLRPDGSVAPLLSSDAGKPSVVVTGVASGGVAVGYAVGSNSSVGQRWGSSGLAQPLGGIPTAISDTGYIVGYSLDGTQQPLRWSPAGIKTALPLGAFGNGRPLATNANGWAAGAIEDQAAVWTPSGSFSLVPAPSGAALSFVGGYGINDSQVVAGWGYDGGSPIGFRWSATTGTQVLPSLGGGGSSSASAINNAGQVIGYSKDASHAARLTLWTPAGQPVEVFRPDEGQSMGNISGINNHGQIAMDLYGGGTPQHAVLLTLQPSWIGGNGQWSDVSHWDWGGAGNAALEFGAMHDVIINPGQSARVQGPADTLVRSLLIGGDASRLVQFDLAGGQTRTVTSAEITSGALLRGSGTLAVQDNFGIITVSRGGQVQVGAGEDMLLNAATVQVGDAGSRLRVEGTTTAQANLTVTGWGVIGFGTEMTLSQGSARFGQLSVIGHATVQDARLSFDQLNTADVGRLQLSFGRSTLEGHITNQGLIVVSNGAEGSFLGEIDNLGELRVSAGGAANFFGHVGGSGTFTGSGTARFEGGLDLSGLAAGSTIEPTVNLGAGAPLDISLDGLSSLTGLPARDGIADTATTGLGGKLHFSHLVTLNGARLVLTAPAGSSFTAGQSFDLFDWDGGLAGSFGSLQLPALSAGLVWDTHALYSDGVLSVTSVPEPATWALWLAGLGLAAWLPRQRGRTH